MYMVIAYDITSDRRRSKLVKVLKDYGTRVNYSVFECEMGKEALVGLKKKIAEIVNKKRDSVLFYELCKGCRGKMDSTGMKGSDESHGIITI
ncbi:MAG: CRISPR-associated endonuclease Cas2 [Candidatus Brocadia sp. UTAMX2]|nr:MAG: CRISPR-associated endonuclease Cas2 [Candidatus Brocadia sp. UTAMX2]